MYAEQTQNVTPSITPRPAIAQLDFKVIQPQNRVAYEFQQRALHPKIARLSTHAFLAFANANATNRVIVLTENVARIKYA